MKAYELLSSSDLWCQESPAKDADGHKVEALSRKAVKWCALAAIQKTYPSCQWETAMDLMLRALSVSEEGIALMTVSDKAGSLMEWNDDGRCSFRDIRETLFQANV